jgi:PncC family amidohydrolase
MSECDINTELISTDMTIADLRITAEEKAKAVIGKFKNLSITLALAESCTAGLVSGLLANTAGASAVLWGSFVCYTQEAKVKMLDLNNEALLADGLVSRQTACFMASGALKKSGADFAAAVTGLAGPDGDGRVPVGTIWVATASRSGTIKAKEYYFTDVDRNTVRIRAAIAVLELIIENGLTRSPRERTVNSFLTRAKCPKGT